MKKNSFKSTAVSSSKSSFGNSKGTSNVPYNRSNSSAFSSNSGSAFVKSPSFKRSASVGGASYNLSSDKKPLSDNHSWKPSKPKFEKPFLATSLANKARFEKSAVEGSKSLSNNNFGSTNPSYKKSLSVGSRFAADSYRPSTKPKYEKSLSVGSNYVSASDLPPSKSSLKSTIKLNCPSNDGKNEKSTGGISNNKGLTVKSNSGFLAPSISPNSKNVVYNRFETSNKMDKNNISSNSGLYSRSVYKYSKKPKDQTSSYYDTAQASLTKKKGFLNDTSGSFNKDSKSIRYSSEDSSNTSKISENYSQNDHHLYNNLTKLFHLKGNSQIKRANPTVLQLSKEIKETALYGQLLINAETCKSTQIQDFKTKESVLNVKTTINKDFRSNDDFHNVTLAVNSLNSKYEVPTAKSCTKMTIFGSAASDASNSVSDAYASGPHHSTSPDTHAHKKKTGLGFNKHIFGHLFAKHPGEKKMKNINDAFGLGQLPLSPVGLNQINTDFIYNPQEENIKGNVDCKAWVDSKQDVINLCGLETQKSSLSSSNCRNIPSNFNQTANAKKTSSIKQEQISQDPHKRFQNEEKTKLIAELLKCYCKQQGKEVCGGNGLKPIQKTPLKSFKQKGVDNGIGMRDVINMTSSHSAIERFKNNVTTNLSVYTPVSSINEKPCIQSKNSTLSKDVNTLAPSSSNNLILQNSRKGSLMAAANICAVSKNPYEPATSSKNSLQYSSHNNKSAIATNENGSFAQLPDIFNQKKDGTHTTAEIPVTPSNSQCNSYQPKNGHLQIFNSNNILSNITHAISTGPLKKSNKEQQRIIPKGKIFEPSATTSDSFAFSSAGITHGGIIPTLDCGNLQTSHFQNSQSSKKASKFSKQKHGPYVELHHDNAFPFMISSRGRHVPISSHARDAILTVLMFSSVNSKRKKVRPKQQRCGGRCGPQQFGNNHNSMGLSALGLALPRASSQPTPLETQLEESDDSDDPLPQMQPFAIPCSKSENDFEHNDYFIGKNLDSHTVDDFRSSYEKVINVINHGRELLSAGNYLQACVEFEVGLKLMDCILESKIDDSDMSPLDKTICKSVQEVIRVDRKAALEGYSDAQAGYVAPPQKQNQQFPEVAPSAPPSYTDVLREDLEKNFFPCGIQCMNVNQQILSEVQLSSVEVPSAPAAEFSEDFSSSPPSYELRESVAYNRIENDSSQNLYSNQKQNESIKPTKSQLTTASFLNLGSSTDEIKKISASPCTEVVESEQALTNETQTAENSTPNEESSVDSVRCEDSQNIVKSMKNNLENNGSIVCNQSKCQVLTSSPSTTEGKSLTTSAENCKSRFTVCLSHQLIEKSKLLNECCKDPKCAPLNHDQKHLSKELCSKPENFKERIENIVNDSMAKSMSTVDTKPPNGKENQTSIIIEGRNKEEELTKECIEKDPHTHSCKSKDLSFSPSKSSSVSAFGSSEKTPIHIKLQVNGTLPPPIPPFPKLQVNGMLPPPVPPFPKLQVNGMLPPPVPSFSLLSHPGQLPSESTFKFLAFPPDVEVLKENDSHIANLKPQITEQRSDLTKAFNDTELESINIYLKDYHDPINVCNSQILDGNVETFSYPNTSNKNINVSNKSESLKKEKNINPECEREAKLFISGNENHHTLDHTNLSDRTTIVLDPFLFEDPFADGCFNRNPDDEEEPFNYDDETCEFSPPQNPKNNYEEIFVPIISSDYCNDQLPLVSGIFKEEFINSQSFRPGSSSYNIPSLKAKNKELSKINNLFFNNQDASVGSKSPEPSTTSSPEVIYSLVDSLETPPLTRMKASESLRGADFSNQPENFFVSDDAADEPFSRENKQQIKITEQNFESNEGNVDKRTLSPVNSSAIRNSNKETHQLGGLQLCNSERKEEAALVYPNVGVTVGVNTAECEDISSESQDKNFLSKTNVENSLTSVTNIMEANPLVIHFNESSSPKQFNSKLEMNIKKGLKSFPFPSFINNKTKRQSSDEGRLIGHSSFFIEVENQKEGGRGVTVMRLQDVKVFFMDSTQNVTSPSTNQTIAFTQKDSKMNCEGSICLEIEKKRWCKYLNVASTKVLKTINKVYLIEEKQDSHLAIQLPSKTKFSVIDEFEEILKKNSTYQTEILAKNTPLKEHRKYINKMESFIKVKSPALYFHAHDLSRKSTRAVQNATASLSKGLLNFNRSKVAISDTPSTTPSTVKLFGQMELLQTKGRLLEEARRKNSIVYI